MNHEDLPLFSVIIATHNRSEVLPRAVNSVLRQTWTDFELIVVDDGSTDATKSVVKSIQDGRVRYLFQRNGGPSSARNAGVQESTGHYVSFLDDDDEALPSWLESFASEVRRTNAAVVCCGFNSVRPDGSVADIELPRGLGPLCHHKTGLFLTGGFAVKREVFNATQGYDEEIRSEENTELSWRLVPHCHARGLSTGIINAPLINRYLHARHEGYAKKKLEGVKYLLEHYSEQLSGHPEFLAKRLTIAAVNAARTGAFSEARSFFWKAICVRPLAVRNYIRFFAVNTPVRTRLWRGSGLTGTHVTWSRRLLNRVRREPVEVE